MSSGENETEGVVQIGDTMMGNNKIQQNAREGNDYSAGQTLDETVCNSRPTNESAANTSRDSGEQSLDRARMPPRDSGVVGGGEISISARNLGDSQDEASGNLPAIPNAEQKQEAVESCPEAPDPLMEDCIHAISGDTYKDDTQLGGVRQFINAEVQTELSSHSDSECAAGCPCFNPPNPTVLSGDGDELISDTERINSPCAVIPREECDASVSVEIDVNSASDVDDEITQARYYEPFSQEDVAQQGLDAAITQYCGASGAAPGDQNNLSVSQLVGTQSDLSMNMYSRPPLILCKHIFPWRP